MYGTCTHQGLHSRSEVVIDKADANVYGATVDGKVAVKIGGGHWEPKGTNFDLIIQGKDYKVWERR